MDTGIPGTGGARREIFVSAVQFEDELRSGKNTVLDLAPLAAKCGVQGVEYRDVFWKDKANELPAVRNQLASLKLKATYTSVTPLYNQDPAMRQQLLQDIEDAKTLGSPLLRVTLGENPEQRRDAAAIRMAARGAIERASKRRIRLSLENNSKAPGHTVEEIRGAVEKYNCRFLVINIDFANFVATGQDPVAAIKALAPRINYTHAKDARKTPGGWKSTYLGNGTLPLQAIIAALDATGKRFPFCFEFPGEGDPEGAIRKSLEFMARLGV
ncbi:MAG TPA: sugar phosphate isomerase/epimerase family protein [Candidatus Acidoferrum sp.]|nr:sugar phosphate isomerase/epimerase family protein [Candidatus Acidoferrum sp.]